MNNKNVIDIKDVEYVAKLSRLKLKEDEMQKFTEQLNSILEYMKKLNKLDTSNIDPTFWPDRLLNRRKDVVKPSFPVEEVLKNAPDKERGYFKVPPIIE